MACGEVVPAVYGYWKAQCLQHSWVDIKRQNRDDAVRNLRNHRRRTKRGA